MRPLSLRILTDLVEDNLEETARGQKETPHVQWSGGRHTGRAGGAANQAPTSAMRIHAARAYLKLAHQAQKELDRENPPRNSARYHEMENAVLRHRSDAYRALKDVKWRG